MPSRPAARTAARSRPSSRDAAASWNDAYSGLARDDVEIATIEGQNGRQGSFSARDHRSICRSQYEWAIGSGS
jgi:hypothetical protein